jgi:hypothetical protein
MDLSLYRCGNQREIGDKSIVFLLDNQRNCVRDIKIVPQLPKISQKDVIYLIRESSIFGSLYVSLIVIYDTSQGSCP